MKIQNKKKKKRRRGRRSRSRRSRIKSKKKTKKKKNAQLFSILRSSTRTHTIHSPTVVHLLLPPFETPPNRKSISPCPPMDVHERGWGWNVVVEVVVVREEKYEEEEEEAGGGG
jgi:hypothetical protein